MVKWSPDTLHPSFKRPSIVSVFGQDLLPCSPSLGPAGFSGSRRAMGSGVKGARMTCKWTGWNGVYVCVWRLVLVCCGIRTVPAQTLRDSKSVYFWETGMAASMLIIRAVGDVLGKSVCVFFGIGTQNWVYIFATVL